MKAGVGPTGLCYCLLFVQTGSPGVTILWKCPLTFTGNQQLNWSDLLNLSLGPPKNGALILLSTRRENRFTKTKHPKLMTVAQPAHCFSSPLTLKLTLTSMTASLSKTRSSCLHNWLPELWFGLSLRIQAVVDFCLITQM